MPRPQYGATPRETVRKDYDETEIKSATPGRISETRLMSSFYDRRRDALRPCSPHIRANNNVSKRLPPDLLLEPFHR